jgi:energy-coupling factor transport system ATP-binding protein
MRHSYPGPDGTEVVALEDISLTVNAGEFVAIIGANGSGKSTLAKHFNALLAPTGGDCFVEGLSTAVPENVWPIRQKVGMVFQNPDNQIVAAVVEEDVAFGPENLGVEPGEIAARVTEALALVGMESYRHHGPHLLSGGQKQRVAIAGVLAMRPKCLVLDEPTAMLDPLGRSEVLGLWPASTRTKG